LDHGVPYAVAAGMTAGLADLLKRAGVSGYRPLWFGPQGSYADSSFIPVWIVMGSTISPSTSSSGGASAGGAGAGGSF
ncbi:MAG TPA: hypothetical protein VF807_10880, partial [Ktedonobacterales bacterium]